MKNSKETLYETMINSLIHKYGLFLTPTQCAETLGISKRTLDDRRRAAQDCPEYLEARKGISFPVQKVVEYQILKSEKCIKII